MDKEERNKKGDSGLWRGARNGMLPLFPHFLKNFKIFSFFSKITFKSSKIFFETMGLLLLLSEGVDDHHAKFIQCLEFSQ